MIGSESDCRSRAIGGESDESVLLGLFRKKRQIRLWRGRARDHGRPNALHIDELDRRLP